jgi:hypothetical protein
MSPAGIVRRRRIGHSVTIVPPSSGMKAPQAVPVDGAVAATHVSLLGSRRYQRKLRPAATRSGARDPSAA